MALFNVIFQKQGEVTASLIPNALSGYAFLFPTAANPSRARELRGAQSIPLRLGVDTSNTALQLSAERLALNLREAAGMYASCPASANPNAELSLRLLHVEAADAASALRETMARFRGRDSLMMSADPPLSTPPNAHFCSLTLWYHCCICPVPTA